MSEQIEKQEKELLYDVSLIGLTMDREILYDRINLRVDLMMEQGLLEEVEGLYNRGYEIVNLFKRLDIKKSMIILRLEPL